jgi:CubicO group peptidase (beta-lactamase class C family)
LPLVPDPFRRIDVPRDLAAVTTIGVEEDPAQAGMTPKAVERIWRSAVEFYKSGVHPAIQLCVRREGVVVLDRAIGHARGNGPRDGDEAEKVLVTPQTPYCVYSGSKGITALVVHMLDERGLLHIGDHVVDYIPEYGAHGKEGTTIAHVLAHRAGIARLPRRALAPENVGDADLALRLICESKPASRPGKALAYHAVSGGFVLGEIVRRVTGKNIRQVLAEEILDPLGFRWTNFGVSPEDVGLVGLDYITGPPVLPPLSTFLTRALGVTVDEVVRLSRDARFLTAVIPAANTITTAGELSRFYEIFRRGGELDGHRVMEPRTLRRALAEQSHLEFDYTLGFPTRFSYGLMLGAKRVSVLGPDTDHAFGHLGFVNSVGWADPERALSAALITSGKPVLYPELPAFFGLMGRIGSAVPKTGKQPPAFW